MNLYPAIDLMDSKAVRLRQGKRDDVTVYGDPLDMAKQWRDLGAKWLHVVDLDAAFEAAHALKGVLGNLGLTPLYEPVAEMTECLRSKTDKDYSAYIDVIEDRVNALNNM